MSYAFGRARLPLACLIALVGLSAAAFAQGGHEITQFGHDITVGPNEEVVEATCFGCSVRVRGNVKTDVTVIGGSLVIEDQGQVGSDATVFGGSIRLDPHVKVQGDVTVFGGRINRDPAAVIGGSITNFSGAAWIFLVFGIPFLLLGGFIALIVWIVHRLTRTSQPATA